MPAVTENPLGPDALATPPIKRTRFETLDALRGLGALLVVMAHGSNIGRSYFNAAFTKGPFLLGAPFRIHFFFVLSGFLIVYLHASDIGPPGTLKKYALKRFIRIFPLYWLITLVVLPVYFLVPSFGGAENTRWENILTSFLLVPLPDGSQPVVGIAWTLRYEVWFYLLFGLAIWRGRRFAAFLLGGWIAACALHFLYSWHTGISPTYFYKAFLNRFNLEFALGGFIAWLLGKQAVPGWARWGFAAGCVILAMSVWLMPRGASAEWSFLSYAVAAGLMVLYGVVNDGSRWPQWLKFLGSASYSIYLVHFIVLSFAAKVVHTLFAPEAPFARMSATCGVIGVALVVGIFTHLFVERPLVRAVRARLLPDPKPLL